MLELVLPLECGRCGAPSTRWCDACAAALKVKPDEPHVVIPRVDPGVPVFALGRYAGPRRQAIVELKERGRRDLVGLLARALALGVHQLMHSGIFDTPVTVVPAPTRASAAGSRGGDPIARIATVATRAHPAITVVPVRTRAMVRDSVGLSSTAPAQPRRPGSADPLGERPGAAGRRHRHHRGDCLRGGADSAHCRGESDGCADARPCVTLVLVTRVERTPKLGRRKGGTSA